MFSYRSLTNYRFRVLLTVRRVYRYLYIMNVVLSILIAYNNKLIPGGKPRVPVYTSALLLAGGMS